MECNNRAITMRFSVCPAVLDTLMRSEDCGGDCDELGDSNPIGRKIYKFSVPRSWRRGSQGFSLAVLATSFLPLIETWTDVNELLEWTPRTPRRTAHETSMAFVNCLSVRMFRLLIL